MKTFGSRYLLGFNVLACSLHTCSLHIGSMHINHHGLWHDLNDLFHQSGSINPLRQIAIQRLYAKWIVRVGIGVFLPVCRNGPGDCDHADHLADQHNA